MEPTHLHQARSATQSSTLAACGTSWMPVRQAARWQMQATYCSVTMVAAQRVQRRKRHSVANIRVSVYWAGGFRIQASQHSTVHGAVTMVAAEQHNIT